MSSTATQIEIDEATATAYLNQPQQRGNGRRYETGTRVRITGTPRDERNGEVVEVEAPDGYRFDVPTGSLDGPWC